METNDHLDDNDFVNADDDGDDNVDNVVDNDAHGGTGADGEESQKGGANSDATEVVPRSGRTKTNLESNAAARK